MKVTYESLVALLEEALKHAEGGDIPAAEKVLARLQNGEIKDD